jgi:WD40 repeat protein
MKKFTLVVLLLSIALSVFSQNVEVFPQLGHANSLSSIAYSPDGRQIISGSQDRTIKLWDVVTGREIRTFSGHTNSVVSVAFSPDGRQIVSGSFDRTIKLWDVVTGREISTFSGHSHLVYSVAFSPDGRQIVSGSFDRTIKLWDLATSREIRTFTGHSDGVAAVAFSPDGRQIVSASFDHTLKLWDAATGREIRAFSGHTDSVISVAFSPDGRQIISGSQDRTIKLWDIATGRVIMTLDHRDNVTAVKFSPDGRQIASGDGRIKLWDTATGREIRTFPNNALAYSLAFSPDGQSIVSTSGAPNIITAFRTVQLWDVTTGRIIKNISSDSPEVRSTTFSFDGRQILSGGGRSNGILKLWDTATGRELRTVSGHSDQITSVAFSPDGRQIVSGSIDRTIKLWDVATGHEIRTFSGHSGFVYAVAFSPDGRQIISGAGGLDSGRVQPDSTIKLWDAVTGQELRTFSGHSDLITSVAFSPDGRQIISGSRDRTIKCWDAATGREIRTLSGHSFSVNSVAFSPDGRQIVSGSSDNTIKLWDVSTGREIRTFSGHSGGVSSASFSPDGRQIVSGSSDNTIKLWDVNTGREIRTFSGHSGGVSSASFSPDGRQIVSGSNDRTIKLWDIATGREIAQFIAFNNDEWIVITPEGYYNASANGDHFLNVRVGNNVYGIEQYRATFFNPEVVRAQLAGTPSGARIQNNIQNIGNFLAPNITLHSPLNRSTITGNAANLNIVIQDNNRPISSVSIMVNGHLHFRSSASDQSINIQGPLQLNQQGDNHIEVIAFNGMSESRQAVTVNWQPTNPPPRRLPDLYILAIGVDHYDSISNLNWCAADARGIVNIFRAQEGTKYNRVHSRIIADGESLLPTADNIRRNLPFLTQSGSVDDYFILFFAGHGGDDGHGGFFFCPRDYNPRVSSSRINSDEILAVLNAPGRRMAFIDACHAGGVIGGQAINSDRLVRVLRESNASIFTAARGIEYALEIGRLQHGVFTHSIIRSLREGQSGTVTMLDLVRDTQRETIRLTDGRQNPNFSALSFEDFPIAIRRGTTTAQSAPSSPGFSQPHRPLPGSTPPSGAPPPRPTAPPASTSTQIWGAVTNLAIWGLQQMLR